MSDKTVPLDDTSMFSNVFSYMGLPFSRDLEDESIDAVVMGVPYDLGTSGHDSTSRGVEGKKPDTCRIHRLI